MRYIKLARIKMAYTGIFVLIFVIIAVHKVQSEWSSGDCNSDVCSDVCKTWSLDGTCVENECRCSTDKKCIDFVCDKVCDVFDLNLEGECDENGLCICKPKLEICSPLECEEPCIANAPPGCIFVYPDFCLDYGPIRTCSCICVTWFNKFKYSGPAKTNILSSKNSFPKKFVANMPYSTKYVPKKSSEFNRKHYTVVARP